MRTTPHPRAWSLLQSKRFRLIVAMLLAVSAVGALGLWDQQREAAASLADFSREQSVLASAIAADVETRLAARARSAEVGTAATAPRPDRDEQLVGDVLGGVRHVEVPGSLILLLARPKAPGFLTTDGRIIPSERLARALERGATGVALARDEAADFGLPRRIAVAGLSRIDAGSGVWGVVVVESAERERDRERRANFRLGLGVVVAAGLVLGFGGIALRQQRHELELARELAVRELERERDAQLIRADKMATLAALSTGVAHELATPLGVILGRAEQLESKLPEDERARRALDAIVEQVHRIQRVMRGFLALARGEAPERERVSPETLVETAVGLVRHRFVKAGVELAVQVEDELAPIACDPPLFEQALVNLLLNACDACGPGGRVEISASQKGGKLVFAVSDDGLGITGEAAQRASEPFFTTKARGLGTGLGLAIVNEVVKHHGGSLSIGPRADPSGRGTRAAIELPELPTTAE